MAKEEPKIKTEEAPQVFTKDEVQKMLDKQKDELRKDAVDTLMIKNAEIKNEVITAGSDNDYNLGKWEIMRKMADDMVKSGALPQSDNVHTIMIKMQAGREMGLKPIESIKAFYIVKGVLNIFGDAVIRRLREHGWTIKPYIEEPNSCTATITKGEETFSETFTFAEAEKSGWTKSSAGLKPGWVEGINRRRKLRYGAMSTLIKTYVPEVLGGAADIAEIAEDTVPMYQGAVPVSLDPVQSSNPATMGQKENIRNMSDYKDMTPEEQEEFEKTLENMTFGEAAGKIKELAQK